MTKYYFSIDNPNQQYVQLEVQLETANDETILTFPSWRPGRYELGDFAKNVKGFKVTGDDGKLIPFNKISKDKWKVDTSATKSISVKYQYYAAELNAGSTYLDNTQLYVNPVNCCLFTDETFNSPAEVILNIPSKWNVATSMENDGSVFKVENIDELFDSPFIASGDLQHQSYESYGTTFHVWFNGEVKPDWEKVIKDFKAFTDKQIEKFTEFPVKEYHFLNQILPYKAYHGVEHQKSTVISLGPTYDVFGDLYTELLGVSSHELYHTWNVKAIRPIEMYPYDFTKENYSHLGYICEGITTYQGDLFLYKSNVFDEAQYFKELTRQFQRHFDNFGRFNYSVAESSFDTWLDGYTPGAPGRKVSIYTEGAILAFVTDVRILKATGLKQSLDDVMKRLYFNFALNSKGVSREDYQSTIENVAGESFEEFFSDYVYGNKPFESIIVESLDFLGLELIHKPVDSYSEAKLGMKTSQSGKEFVVKAMYPGGPAETGGVMLEDRIIGINGYNVNGDLDKWLNYFDDNQKEVLIDRNGKLITLILPEVNRTFFNEYSIQKISNPNNLQKRAYESWIK